MFSDYEDRGSKVGRKKIDLRRIKKCKRDIYIEENLFNSIFFIIGIYIYIY